MFKNSEKSTVRLRQQDQPWGRETQLGSGSGVHVLGETLLLPPPATPHLQCIMENWDSGVMATGICEQQKDQGGKAGWAQFTSYIFIFFP